jgi:hypothetical protein
MTLDDLLQYAYTKRPLTEVYANPKEVPDEFWYDWWKDAYDYQREQEDEELKDRMSLTPRDILTWLEEAAEFVWKSKEIQRFVPK